MIPEPVVINQTDLSPDEVRQLLNMGFEVEQGSEAWFEERNGKATASEFRKIVARDKRNKMPYADYYNYMLELVVERLTEKEKRFKSRITDHGHNYEPVAASAYEEARPDADVRECKFIEHPELAAGASPDRLIDDDGVMEIKNPQSDTFIKYLMSHIPDDSPDVELRDMLNLKGDEWKYYMDQIQGQLWTTGRKWCDFVVYDPDLPDNVQLSITRVERDNEYIDNVLEPRVREFLGKVDRLERYIRNYKGDS